MVFMETFMKNPVVYVGIVSYHSASLMDACLKALNRQTYKKVLISVWDNANEHRVKQISHTHRAAYHGSQKNLGFGAAHNAIIRTLHLKDSDYYLALNPDAVLEPMFIKELVKALEINGAGWATGTLYRNKGTKELYSVGHAVQRDGYAYNIGFGLRDIGQYDSRRTVFGAPGAAALYSAPLIRTITRKGQFFDENIFLYYEDIDVDWRANKAGFHCLYVPTALGLHRGGTPPISLEAEILANRFYVLLKNADTRSLWYLFPLVTAHCLFRLFTSPATGIRLCTLVPRALMRALIARKQNAYQHDMNHWFTIATQEQTRQPRTYAERLRAYTSHIFHNSTGRRE